MTRFLKGYRIVLWIVLLAVIIPLIAAAFYSRPTSDDVKYLYETREADAGKSAIQTAFERAVKQWYTFTGTFSSIIFYYFLWAVCREPLTVIYPAAIIAFIIFTCFLMTRCLRVMKPDVPKAATDCLALLLSIMLMLFNPSAYDSLYWVVGSVYELGLMLSICGFCGLFCQCWRSGKASAGEYVFIGAMCLLFFIIGGGDHLNALSSIVLYGFFALWVFVVKKPKKYLIPFLFLVAGCALAALAPSNSIRQGYIGERMSLVKGVIFSCLQAVRFSFEDMRVWVFLVLCLPVFWEIAAHLPFTGKQVFWIVFASVAIMASTIFPITWTKHGSLPRHLAKYMFTLCPLLILCCLANVSCLRRWMTERAGLAPAKDRMPVPVGYVCAVFCAAAFAIVSMSTPNLDNPSFLKNCQIPTVYAVGSFLDGSFAAYARDYDQLTARLKSDGGNVVIDSYPVNALLGGPYFDDDPTYWQNEQFAKYYGGENATLVYVGTHEGEE